MTDITIKQLKHEWNNLSMSSTGLMVDEFVSYVIKKSDNLQMVGVSVSKKDETLTLGGLSTPFQWD